MAGGARDTVLPLRGGKPASGGQNFAAFVVLALLGVFGYGQLFTSNNHTSGLSPVSATTGELRHRFVTRCSCGGGVFERHARVAWPCRSDRRWRAGASVGSATSGRLFSGDVTRHFPAGNAPAASRETNTAEAHVAAARGAQVCTPRKPGICLRHSAPP